MVSLSWPQFSKRMKAQRVRKQEHHLTEVDDWSTKWRSKTRFNGSFHVITLNVGPRGIQPCLQRINELFRDFSGTPAVIHIQDIKMTDRRSKTIHDFLKDQLPDYTAYYEIHPARKARRYNLGVLSLIRNYVAYGADRMSLKDVIAQDANLSAEPTEELLQACAG
jgi:hypothetical protein